MISITGIMVKLANHSLVMCAQFKNVGSTFICESFTAHFSCRKIFTIPFTHRKSRIKRHPVEGIRYWHFVRNLLLFGIHLPQMIYLREEYSIENAVSQYFCYLFSKIRIEKKPSIIKNQNLFENAKSHCISITQSDSFDQFLCDG